MDRMSRFYQPDLEKLGFVFEESGELSLDNSTFQNAVLDEGGLAQLSGIRNFTNSVLRKTDQISLNPV